MHPNLSHCLIYFLPQKCEEGFICQKGRRFFFVRGSFWISSLFFLEWLSNSWFYPIENEAWCLFSVSQAVLQLQFYNSDAENMTHGFMFFLIFFFVWSKCSISFKNEGNQPCCMNSEISVITFFVRFSFLLPVLFNILHFILS